MNLHLRDAGLTFADAATIAETLASIDPNGSPLKSFSVSYNTGLGNQGVVMLLSALPSTVTDIGIVGCDLGDEAGQALLDLVHGWEKLRMICAEGNAFSPAMRQRLLDLRHCKAGLQLFL